MFEKIGRWLAKYPLMAIAIVMLVTLLSIISIGYFGIKQKFNEESFMPDLKEVKANNEITDNFTSTYDVTILVRGEDVLTKNSMLEILTIEKSIANSSVREMLYTPFEPSYSIGGVADIITQFILQQRGIENPSYEEKMAVIEQMNDTQIKNTIKNMLTSIFTPASIKSLFTMSLTKDFNISNLRAKGSIIRISMNYSLRKSEEEALAMEREIERVVKENNLASIRAYVMGSKLFQMR